MTPDSEQRGFSLDGSTLTVHGNLDWEDQKAFSGALSALLQTGHKELVIDLSSADYASSAQLGPLAAAIVDAKGEGRTVTVLAKKHVARILDACGLGKVVTIRLASDS